MHSYLIYGTLVWLSLYNNAYCVENTHDSQEQARLAAYLSSNTAAQRCMPHVDGCRLVWSEMFDRFGACRSDMEFYECVTSSHISASCQHNQVVNHYIYSIGQLRLFTASVCASNIDCSDDDFLTCISDDGGILNQLFSGVDVTSAVIPYTQALCSAFGEITRCLPSVSTSCLSPWLPSGALNDMIRDVQRNCDDDYVEAVPEQTDLISIIAEDTEANSCTERSRGYCVDQYMDDVTLQNWCSPLMAFYNCALTSVQTTTPCTTNTRVADFVSTIEKLRIYAAATCATDNDCNSVFHQCFSYEYDLDLLFGSGTVDDAQFTYTNDACLVLEEVIHCLSLQEDDECYPWLLDDTLDTMRDTLSNRCSHDYIHETMLLASVLREDDDAAQCMSHTESCEITLYRPSYSDTVCGSYMKFYECILDDVSSLSTSCARNPIVEKYIDHAQKLRIQTAAFCGSNLDCSRTSFNRCLNDHTPLLNRLFTDNGNDLEEISYTSTICSAFRRSVYCVDAIRGSCSSDWLPPSAVRDMSAHLTDVSCAVGHESSSTPVPHQTSDIPSSFSSATILRGTQISGVVTLMLYFLI